MNEFDRKTMQEKLTLLSVTKATRSGWYTAQNEYSVVIGSLASGTYLQTQVADGDFEAFREEPVLVNMSFNPSSRYSETKVDVVSNNFFESKIVETGLNRLNINNFFTLDLSAFPLSDVQGIEIALRYNVSQNNEKWFLKAYNWSRSNFSDYGFNDTDGNLPHLDLWNDYVVNVTSNWRDYIGSKGTVLIELEDEGHIKNPATVQIDFFGVNEVINGVRVDMHNSGPLAAHVVATWMINSTYHDRRDVDILVNPATDASITIADLTFPQDNFTVKVATEIGNEAVFP
jgi:hypothetical protein